LEKNLANIIGGLEAGLSAAVREKMSHPFLPNEDNTVINSLIQAVFDQYGSDT